MRHLFIILSIQRHRRFNPRRDLFLFATSSRRGYHEARCQFQSQAGFVPLCDRHQLAAQGGIYPRFNPRRDLFLFATFPSCYTMCECLRVSIPGGICSSLRPWPRLASRLWTGCFNPRRDLFLFATPELGQGQKKHPEFQSQAGFVPLCDPGQNQQLLTSSGVSIPGGICSSLRRRYIPEDVLVLRNGFNPRRDLFLFATP